MLADQSKSIVRGTDTCFFDSTFKFSIVESHGKIYIAFDITETMCDEMTQGTNVRTSY